MNFQTDLAIERHEMLKKEKTRLLNQEKYDVESIKISKLTIKNEKLSKIYDKPIGKYVTVEISGFDLSANEIKAISDEISSLLPEDGLILVCGLGNDDITADALGPKCVDNILSTRHIKEEFAKNIGLDSLRAVACIIPGVLGKTGIETIEIIKGVVNAIKPKAVIVIDSLASRKLSRLGKTIQITNTGITPGSGIGNSRKEISKKILGIDVISIGVPTVVGARTLLSDIVNEENIDTIISKDEQKLIVTSKDIDFWIKRASKAIALSINIALQKNISTEDIISLTS